MLRLGDGVLPIEVISGRNKGALGGLRGFAGSFDTTTSLLVGTGGVAPVQSKVWVEDAEQRKCVGRVSEA